MQQLDSYESFVSSYDMTIGEPSFEGLDLKAQIAASKLGCRRRDQRAILSDSVPPSGWFVTGICPSCLSDIYAFEMNDYLDVRSVRGVEPVSVRLEPS